MDSEHGEQSDEAKYQLLLEEMHAFNRETNNYIGMIIRGIDDRGWETIIPEKIEAMRMALSEKGITDEDREHFFKIWWEYEPINAENYDFTTRILKAIIDIFQELQDGKYLGIKFERARLIG